MIPNEILTFISSDNNFELFKCLVTPDKDYYNETYHDLMKQAFQLKMARMKYQITYEFIGQLAQWADNRISQTEDKSKKYDDYESIVNAEEGGADIQTKAVGKKLSQRWEMQIQQFKQSLVNSNNQKVARMKIWDKDGNFHVVLGAKHKYRDDDGTLIEEIKFNKPKLIKELFKEAAAYSHEKIENALRDVAIIFSKYRVELDDRANESPEEASKAIKDLFKGYFSEIGDALDDIIKKESVIKVKEKNLKKEITSDEVSARKRTYINLMNSECRQSALLRDLVDRGVLNKDEIEKSFDDKNIQMPGVCSVHVSDNKEQNLLHYAFNEKQPPKQIIMWLIRNGADIFQLNNQNRTPIEVCVRNYLLKIQSRMGPVSDVGREMQDASFVDHFADIISNIISKYTVGTPGYLNQLKTTYHLILGYYRAVMMYRDDWQKEGGKLSAFKSKLVERKAKGNFQWLYKLVNLIESMTLPNSTIHKQRRFDIELLRETIVDAFRDGLIFEIESRMKQVKQQSQFGLTGGSRLFSSASKFAKRITQSSSRVSNEFLDQFDASRERVESLRELREPDDSSSSVSSSASSSASSPNSLRTSTLEDASDSLSSQDNLLGEMATNEWMMWDSDDDLDDKVSTDKYQHSSIEMVRL